MKYTVTVRTAVQNDDADTQYDEATAVHMLRTALHHQLALSADADASTVTLTAPDRTITLSPSDALPRITLGARRGLEDLTRSGMPVTWVYSRRNVARLSCGDLEINHQMSMSLLNSGLVYGPGHSGMPAEVTLLAHLVVAAPKNASKHMRDANLSSALRRAYGA